MTHRFHSIMLAAFVMFLGGCHAPLPVYEPMPPLASKELIANRFRTIEVVRVFGQMKLASNDGHRATVDFATIHDGTHIKMRIWKFNTAIYDLTVADDGIWVFDALKERDDSMTIDPDSIFQTWNLFMGSHFLDPATHEHSTGTTTISYAQDHPESEILSVIDRHHLLTQSYTITRKYGATHSMELSRYRMMNDSPWPTNMSLVGPDGQIGIYIKDLVFEQIGSQNLFKPSKRAERYR